MRTILVPLVFLIVLSSAAAPLPSDLVAQFESRSLEAAGGATATGDLGAFVLNNPTGTGWSASSREGFRLDARELHVDAYETHTAYSIGGAATTEWKRGHTPVDHHAAHVTSDAPRGMFELVILPVPGMIQPQLSVSATALQFNAAPPQRVVALDMTDQIDLSNDVPASAPLGTLVGLQSIVVEGDFRVSLWSWNATVRTEEGTTRYPSGTSYETVVADPSGNNPGVRRGERLDQVVLDVRGGRLEFEAVPATPHVISWTDVDVHALSIDARQAQGTVVGALDVRAETLHLEGDLRGRVRAADDHLASDVSGRLVASSMDGVVIPVATAPGRASSWNAAWLGIILVAPAAWGANAWRRRRDHARMDDLETLAVMGDPRSVVEAATRLERNRDHGRDASALKVDALLRLGRTEEADAYVAALRGWDGPAAAVHDYLVALVAGHRGDRERARTHLERALTVAPELAGDAAAQPALAGLLGDPASPVAHVEGYR